VLARAALDLTRGEAGQLASAHDLDVGEDEYFERCRRKTASLFVAACRIGALLGESRRATADRLASVAERLGVAYQILDDVLDLAAPSEATGKPRGADLRDGTVTLPMILALRSDPGLRREIAQARSAGDLTALCDRLADHPGTFLAREEGRRQLRLARRTLDRLPPDVATGTLGKAVDLLDARLAAPVPRAEAA
jgi:geranylgeranyl pyrophosphate synthase